MDEPRLYFILQWMNSNPFPSPLRPPMDESQSLQQAMDESLHPFSLQWTNPNPVTPSASNGRIPSPPSACKVRIPIPSPLWPPMDESQSLHPFSKQWTKPIPSSACNGRIPSPLHLVMDEFQSVHPFDPIEVKADGFTISLPIHKRPSKWVTSSSHQATCTPVSVSSPRKTVLKDPLPMLTSNFKNRPLGEVATISSLSSSFSLFGSHRSTSSLSSSSFDRLSCSSSLSSFGGNESGRSTHVTSIDRQRPSSGSAKDFSQRGPSKQIPCGRTSCSGPQLRPSERKSTFLHADSADETSGTSATSQASFDFVDDDGSEDFPESSDMELKERLLSLSGLDVLHESFEHRSESWAVWHSLEIPSGTETDAFSPLTFLSTEPGYPPSSGGATFSRDLLHWQRTSFSRLGNRVIDPSETRADRVINDTSGLPRFLPSMVHVLLNRETRPGRLGLRVRLSVVESGETALEGFMWSCCCCCCCLASQSSFWWGSCCCLGLLLKLRFMFFFATGLRLFDDFELRRCSRRMCEDGGSFSLTVAFGELPVPGVLSLCARQPVLICCRVCCFWSRGLDILAGQNHHRPPYEWQKTWQDSFAKFTPSDDKPEI